MPWPLARSPDFTDCPPRTSSRPTICCPTLTAIATSVTSSRSTSTARVSRLETVSPAPLSAERANEVGSLTHWYYFPKTDVTIVIHNNSNEASTPLEVMNLVYRIYGMVTGDVVPTTPSAAKP